MEDQLFWHFLEQSSQEVMALRIKGNLLEIVQDKIAQSEELSRLHKR